MKKVTSPKVLVKNISEIPGMFKNLTPERKHTFLEVRSTLAGTRLSSNILKDLALTSTGKNEEWMYWTKKVALFR